VPKFGRPISSTTKAPAAVVNSQLASSWGETLRSDFFSAGLSSSESTA
jgi:hypothetical protein